MTAETIFKDYDVDYFQGMRDYIKGVERVQQIQLKEDIPFMISDQAEIVCLPKSKDPPTVGFLGQKRTGKTLMLAGLRDRKFFYQSEPCIWANDYSSETFAAREPMQNPQFVKMLRDMGEEPIGYGDRLLHLFPGNINPRISKTKYNTMRVGVPLKKFIERFELFVGAAGKLGGSEDYFNLMKPSLLQCKGPEEMKRAIFDFDLDMGKAEGKIKMKIWTRFYNALINEGIVDISSPELVSEVQVKDEDDIVQSGNLNPMIGTSYYGYLPVIMTQEILTKKYFPGLYTSMLEELFMTQRYGIEDKNRRPVNIFFDELRIVARRKLNQEKKEYQNVVETINQLVAQGGPARISLYYGTQNPSEVPDVVFDNTKYVICTSLTKDESDTVANLFGLPKAEFAKRVAGLDKSSMQCIAVTNEEFVTYDPLNNRKDKIGGEVKGIFLPPLSNTIPPILPTEE